MKRIISYLLVFAMLFSCLPVSAFATGGTTRGGGAGRRVTEIVSGFDTYGSSYPDHLVSSGEAFEVDRNTFSGLSVTGSYSEHSLVSMYMPGGDTDEPDVAYSIKIPPASGGILAGTFVAQKLIIEDLGVWHFSNFYSNPLYEHISLYLEGTVATFVLFYRGLELYEVYVVDYATYDVYTAILEYLDEISSKLNDMPGGSGGGSVEVDTSEMESLLSEVNDALGSISYCLSGINSNVVDIEGYVDELEDYLSFIGNSCVGIYTSVNSLEDYCDHFLANLLLVSNDIASISRETYANFFQLEEINAKITECTTLTNEILTTIATDVGDIKQDVSDIKDILSSIESESVKSILEPFLSFCFNDAYFPVYFNCMFNNSFSGKFAYLNDRYYFSASASQNILNKYHDISLSLGEDLVSLLSVTSISDVYPDSGDNSACFCVDPFNGRVHEEYQKYLFCGSKIVIEENGLIHLFPKVGTSSYYAVSFLFDGNTGIFLYWTNNRSFEIVMVDYSSYSDLTDVEDLLFDILSKIDSSFIDVSESKGILAAIRDKIDTVHSDIVDKLDELIAAVHNIGGGGSSSGSDGSSFVADLLGGVFGVVFDALKLLVNLIFNLLSSVFGWIARFSAFVTSLWSGFIPAKTLSVLLIIPPLSLILGVVKFVRG